MEKPAKGPRILHAEPSASFRSLYQAVLVQEGYEVLGVEDPHRMLGMIVNKTFDLLILDPALFGTDGPRAIHRITQIFPSARIVILTSNSSPAWIQAADLEGVSEYFIKSQTSASSLVTRIEEIIEWVQAKETQN